MSRHSKWLWLIPAMASVGGLPATVQAQDQPAAGGLEEITVTARRRDESVQDVPLSVQAFSAEQMELKGIERVENVVQNSPNVMISSGPSGQASPSFAMRGIPGAGFFIDGVFQNTSVGLGQRSVMEIERVEVLRGPQGTLFGRDSTGGALRIFTKLPAAEFGVRAQATIGSYERRDLSVHTDIPITDTFRTKFSFIGENRDGYVRSLITGRSTGEIDDQTVRADFLWLPNDKFTARLFANKSRQRSTQPNYTFYIHEYGVDGPSPGGGFTVPPHQYYEALGIRYDCQSNVPECPGGIVGDLESMDNYDGGPGVKVDEDNFNLKLDYALNDAWAINSLTNFTKQDTWFLSNFDNTWVDFWSQGTAAKRESWSQEFQINTNIGRFHAVTGLYGWNTNNKSHGFRWALFDFDCGVAPITVTGQPGGCSTTPRFTFAQLNATPFCQTVTAPNSPCSRLGLVSNDTLGETEQEGYAAFGEYTFDLTRTFSITAGLRYHDQDNDTWTLAFAPNTPRRSNIPGHLPAGDLFINGGRTQPRHLSFQKTTYRGALTNKFTEDLMVYAGFSQGYNTGGVSRINIPDANGVLVNTDFPFDPEEIENYEIGMRSDWLNRTLRLNLTVFHTDWDSIQLSGTVRNPLTGEVLPTFLTQNAASAEAEGVELEGTWLPIDGLQLNLGVGILDTGYTEILPSVANDIQLDDNFGMAPEEQISFGAQYTHQIASGASLLYRVDWNYTSGFNRTYVPGDQRGSFTGEEWEQDPYSLLQARLMYTAPSDRWSVALFGTNLTDERYTTGGFISPLLSIDDGTVGRPREFGLTFKATFQ